jgi:hypothetical protein
MWQDDILDEIHKFREEHAKSFNYDLDAMFVDWQKRQAESGRQVVSLPPKQGLNRSENSQEYKINSTIEPKTEPESCKLLLTYLMNWCNISIATISAVKF